MSERPHRTRTWAPKGQTPVLQYHFTWKTLSAIAGITFWNFYFRLFPGAIRSPQIIEFLTHLPRHIPGKLLIVWDGLPAHRSRAVWDFVRQQRGRIWLEFLPAYAPELNPTEYIWGHLKQHEIANLCLLLAAVGIHGVVAYTTRQRTREIGIRMALGAEKLQIYRLVLRQGLWLTLSGLVVGTALSLAFTRFLKSRLFGVSETDALTFASVGLLLAAVALLACHIPARRAIKVEPTLALRAE